MKTNINIVIATIEEAKKFLTELYENKEAYHPEDSALNIVKPGSNEPFFTKKEAKKLDALMDVMFSMPDFNPCDVIYELWQNELKMQPEIVTECPPCQNFAK